MTIWPPIGVVRPYVPNLTDWRDEALCAEIDRDLFFPERGETARTARKVCARCEVRAECLEWALSLRAEDDEYGVLGGTTATERRSLRRQRRATEAGQEAA
jgi:WhiB family transcriptional regulator, redox-sensing transcriptional regulator